MKHIYMAFKKNEFLDPILEMLIQNSSEAGPRIRPRAHLKLPDVYDSQARYLAPSKSRTGKLISTTTIREHLCGTVKLSSVFKTG